jgi:acyl carrier protein
MTEDEMIKRCPDIVKVTPQIMNEIVYNIIGEPLDMNKTWYDNGLDDLDCVEFIMYIEKRLDIVIPDDVAGAFTRYNEKPKVFRSYLRNKKIEQLGL